jgi:hypothetical protein
LKGLPCSAWVRAISDRVYLTTRNLINVPICFESSRGTAEKKALVDSGATKNFIDWQLAKALKVQTTLLPRPRKVYNVDGMENKAGVIERHVKLRVRQGDKERVQTLKILGTPTSFLDTLGCTTSNHKSTGSAARLLDRLGHWNPSSGNWHGDGERRTSRKLIAPTWPRNGPLKPQRSAI